MHKEQQESKGLTTDNVSLHPLAVEWNLELTDLFLQVQALHGNAVALRLEQSNVLVVLDDLPPACHAAFTLWPYAKSDGNGRPYTDDAEAFLGAREVLFAALDSFDYEAYEAELQTPA